MSTPPLRLSRRLCFGLVASISIGALLNAPAARSDELGDYLRQQVQARHIVGMAVAVIDHHKIRREAVYGKASLEFDVPVTLRTPFQVASISKSFTAVAIMIMVEQGRLRLDDPIGSHLDGLPVAWRRVTVRELLNNTSGIPDIEVDNYGTATIVQTPAEMIRVLGSRPMYFTPGSEYRYTQTNYVLLQMLIERLSGESYETFCRDHLFSSPKLSSAGFGDSRTIVPGKASLYTPFRFGGAKPVLMDHGEILSAEMPPMTYAGGGLYISIADFARWLNALLDGRIISKSSLDKIWAPAKLNDGTVYRRPHVPTLWREYGLGWVLELEGPHPFVGGTGGIRAAFFVYPRDELAVIVLTNTQGTLPETLAEAIAYRFLGSRSASIK